MKFVGSVNKAQNYNDNYDNTILWTPPIIHLDYLNYYYSFQLLLIFFVASSGVLFPCSLSWNLYSIGKWMVKTELTITTTRSRIFIRNNRDRKKKQEWNNLFLVKTLTTCTDTRCVLVARLVPNSQVCTYLWCDVASQYSRVNQSSRARKKWTKKRTQSEVGQAQAARCICVSYYFVADFVSLLLISSFFFSLSRVFSYTLRAEISGERPTLFGTVFLRVLRMSFHGHNHRLYIVCVCVAILQIDENDRECESELQFASITGDYGINFLEATVPSNDNRIEISQFNWYHQCHNILSRTTIFQLVSWCVRPMFLHETIFILYPFFCCYFFHSVIWFRLRKLSCSFDVVGLTVCDRSICIACHLFQVIIKKGFNMKLDVMKYSSAGRVHRRRMEIRSKIVI